MLYFWVLNQEKCYNWGMFTLTDYTKTRIKIFLTVVVIIFGIYLRTVPLIQNNSIFLDEGLLIVNFHEKHYWQMFLPLNYMQAAPPIFLILSKFMYQLFGVNEMALRFLPYMASNLSLILFYFLLKKVFKNYIAILIALFAFAINPQLSWFGAFLKPYSFDVLFTIIALLVALNIDLLKLNKKKALMLGVLAAISVWCSYAMLFVICGISLVFMSQVYLSKDQKLKKIFWVYAIPNIIGFFIYFAINLLWVKMNPQLQHFWTTYFSFSPRSYKDYKAIITFLFNYSDIRLTSLLMLSGIYLFCKQDEFKFWVLAFPVMICLISSYFGIYPFAHRLVLFTLPIFTVFIFKPLDESALNKKIYSLIIIFLSISFLSPVCKYFCAEVIKDKFSFAYANTREGYAELKKEIKSDEHVYVYFYSYPSFKSYNYKFKIPDSQITYGAYHSDQYTQYLDELNKLPKNKVTWFVMLEEPYTQRECSVINGWIKSHAKIKEEKTIGKAILIKAYVK